MPVQYSIRTRGADLVRQGLQDLRAQVPQIGAQHMYEAMERARGRVITAPPEIGGTNYVRTGTYERGWVVRRNPGGGGRVMPGYALIGSAVDRRGRDYTKYVGGDAYGQSQARVHQGRWVPARGAVDKEVERLPQTVQDHLTSVSRRL